LKVRYTAKTRTSGGRRGGVSRSDDGRLDVTFSAPGIPGTGTNPEQLFAAGWSACFISAMGLVANKMKVKLPADTAVDAEIDLCNSGDVYFLRARLNVSLPGLEREVAQAIVDATHGTVQIYKKRINPCRIIIPAQTSAFRTGTPDWISLICMRFRNLETPANPF
jgi:Ohr subfamily peroxiredoxin